MSWLRSLTIQVRLAVISLIVLLMMLTVTLVGLSKEKALLYELNEQNAKALVDVSLDLVNQHYQAFQSGKVSLQQAQQNAQESLKKIRYGQGNYFWVGDLDGTMLMHPVKPALEGKSVRNVKSPDGEPVYESLISDVKSKGEAIANYQWPRSGKEGYGSKMTYVKQFKPWGWVLGSGLFVDDIEQGFAAHRNSLLLETFLLSLVIAGFCYWLGRSIVAPVQQTTAVMQNIAMGDGDLTRKLDDSGRDEIASLSYYFNKFTNKLGDSLRSVQDSYFHVVTDAKTVSEAVDAGRGYAKFQMENTNAVAASIGQMTTQIKEVSEHANDAEKAATEALQNTDNGKRVISNTITQIHSLSGNVNEASEVITRLAKESEDIGKVLDVIRGIAEQTNLLALNAAIEAARAGEQGRGFAVVADEVRTLASRTGQSTDEIQTMIERLQEGARAAVEAVTLSQETSESTVVQVAKADEALSEIARLMQVISGMNGEIALATNTQLQTADQVNSRVNELAASVELSRENTEHLNEASADLDDSSKKMSAVVNSFKIN